MQMLSEEHHAAIKNAANKRKTELKEKTNG
jgi:hypothetical protein